MVIIFNQTFNFLFLDNENIYWLTEIMNLIISTSNTYFKQKLPTCLYEKFHWKIIRMNVRSVAPSKVLKKNLWPVVLRNSFFPDNSLSID